MARKYGKASQKEVKNEMHRFKRGKAHSGKGEAKVKSREQAIAIGLSKARKKGIKVPKKSSAKTTRSTALKSKKRKSTSKSTLASKRKTRTTKAIKKTRKSPAKTKTGLKKRTASRSRTSRSRK